jgi:hypothetical protein
MNKIPKIIHYCWFGGKALPPLALKCIESWKKYCPDYEIIEWNESNFDLDYNIYVKEAYKEEKWAFVSDVARLYAVYVHGGIYLDTDVEIIKPIDNFLDSSMFIGFEKDSILLELMNNNMNVYTENDDIFSKYRNSILASPKNDTQINTGLGFGAEKKFHIVKKMLELYNNISFKNHNGSCNILPCTVYNTMIMQQEGFIMNDVQQTINNVTVYPKDYFCPKDYNTRIINITENTHTIHHFEGSWLTAGQKEHAIIAEYKNKYGKKLGVIYMLLRQFAIYVEAE